MEMQGASLYALVALFALWCVCAQGAGLGIGPVGTLHYKDSNSHCSMLEESCAPCSDIWGMSMKGVNYALVGTVNGLSIVDVGNPHQPREVSRVPGCLTEWRDIKTYKQWAFVVNDKTALCACEKEDCEFYAQVKQPASLVGDVAATEGQVTKPLHELPDGTLEAEVVAAQPRDGCSALTNGATVSGKIALMERGACAFDEKIRNAQAAGAVAVVIYNDRVDLVQPSMQGESTNITIPGVMISKPDGEAWLQYLSTGQGPLVISLDEDNFRHNELYLPSQGLVTLDLSEPAAPVVLPHKQNWFKFAHNILVDEGLNQLIVCGRDTRSGILILNVLNPEAPFAVGEWYTSNDRNDYIHDMQVVEWTPPDGGGIKRRLLFAAAIYVGRVYVLDITDPARIIVHYEWETREMTHNIDVVSHTEYGNVAYVTHESSSAPVTVWHLDRNWMNAKKEDEFGVNSDAGTIPHNVFYKDNMLWLSYYSEGVVLFNAENPLHPTFLARYDTSTYTSGFHGVWGLFPFVASNPGLMYASDIEDGLHVLNITGRTGVQDWSVQRKLTGHENVAVLTMVFGLLCTIGVAAYVMYAQRSVPPM